STITSRRRGASVRPAERTTATQTVTNTESDLLKFLALGENPLGYSADKAPLLPVAKTPQAGQARAASSVVIR
ncbi:hypothetical protein ACWDA7_51920, partial [Streptomyces sp. NPDC001156]